MSGGEFERIDAATRDLPLATTIETMEFLCGDTQSLTDPLTQTQITR